MHRIRRLLVHSIQLVEFPSIYYAVFAAHGRALTATHVDQHLERPRNSVVGIAAVHTADGSVVDGSVVDVAVDAAPVASSVDNDSVANTIPAHPPRRHQSFSSHFRTTGNSTMAPGQTESISFGAHTNCDRRLQVVDSMALWPMQSLAMCSPQWANQICPLLSMDVDR